MWEISNTAQLLTLLFSFALGLILCVVYIIINAFKRSFFLKSAFVPDFLFWVTAAALTFIFLLSRTNGEIRGFVFFFEAAGFLTARYILFGLLSAFFIKVFAFLSFVFRFLAGVSYKFSVFICFCVKKIAKKLKYAHFAAKKLLKNKVNIVYNKSNISEVEKDAGES